MNENVPEVYLGAEVYLEQGLHECDELNRFCIENTKYIMLELPYTNYRDWMAAEIYNICYSYSLIPILAHLDRYIDKIKREQINELLSIDNVVIQINNDALNYRSNVKFVMELLQDGNSVIFGSDSHNLKDRAPNFNISNKVLSSKLKRNELLAIADTQERILSIAKSHIYK
jgi:protein-tyrosine phosphatase